MGFPSTDFQRECEAIDYRLGLALYGACGFLLSFWLAKTFDPVVYDLAARVDKVWKPIPPAYPGGQKVYWLSVALFLFLLIAPKLGHKIPASLSRNSLSYALFAMFVYFCLTCVSLITFGLSGALMVQFIGYSFIIGSTEFLKGLGIALRERAWLKASFNYGISPMKDAFIRQSLTTAIGDINRDGRAELFVRFLKEGPYEGVDCPRSQKISYLVLNTTAGEAHLALKNMWPPILCITTTENP